MPLSLGHGCRDRPADSAEQITIGGFGNLDTNGMLYVALADNDPADVTPRVSGNKHYTFGVGRQKYTPTITANDGPLDPDTVVNGADFCVGQYIKFDITGLPSRVYDLTVVWTLPGTFVNTNSDPNCDLFYEENAAILKPPQGTSATHCWYVKDGQPLTASVRLLYRCTVNGKLFDQTVTGQFNVHRPTCHMFPSRRWHAYGDGDEWLLTLGDGDCHHDMSFKHQIQTDTFCSGQAGYTQLISGEYTESVLVIYPIGGFNPEWTLIVCWVNFREDSLRFQPIPIARLFFGTDHTTH